MDDRSLDHADPQGRRGPAAGNAGPDEVAVPAPRGGAEADAPPDGQADTAAVALRIALLRSVDESRRLTGADSDSALHAGAHTNTDAGAHTNTDAGADTQTDAGADTQTDGVALTVAVTKAERTRPSRLRAGADRGHRAPPLRSR